MKLSQGDTVLVISGKYKGKKGMVLKVFRDSNKVVVADINVRTKHIKRTAQSAGSKITFEAPMSASNVMLLDAKSGKPTRVGYKVDVKTGKKIRIARLSGEAITKGKVDKKAKDKMNAAVKPEGAKSSFWNKGKDAAADDSQTPRGGEGGGGAAATMHTRSAGRGS